MKPNPLVYHASAESLVPIPISDLRPGGVFPETVPVAWSNDGVLERSVGFGHHTDREATTTLGCGRDLGRHHGHAYHALSDRGMAPTGS